LTNFGGLSITETESSLYLIKWNGTTWTSGKVHVGAKGYVDAQIAIASTDATTKSNAALASAKTYTDTEINELNMDVLHPLSSGYYTLTTALAAVETKYKKLNVRICFASAAGVVESYQLIGAVAGWSTTSNWKSTVGGTDNTLSAKVDQLFYGQIVSTLHSAHYINNSGVLISSASFDSLITDIDSCVEGDTYNYDGTSTTASPGWLMYNNSTLVSVGYGTKSTVTIPTGVNGIKFSSYVVAGTTPHLNVNKNTYTDIKVATLSGLLDKVQLIDNMMLGEANKTLNIGKYFNNTGAFSTSLAYNSYVTDKIACVEGDEFIYKGNAIGNGASYVLYNASTVVSYGTIAGTAKVTIPSGVDGVIFASMQTVAIGPSINVLSYSFLKEYIESEIAIAPYTTNYLKGKKWYLVGDSEAAGDTVSGTSKTTAYSACIANRTGIVLTNNAIMGSQVVTAGANSLYDTYLAKIGSDAEYIGVHIGFNDTYDSSESDSSTDATKFKGAFNLLLSGILTNYPTAKLFLVIPYYFDKSTTRVDRAAWLKQRCIFYNIPYLDIVEKCGLNYSITAQQSVYFGDVVHLKPVGHLRISYIVEQFMKGL